MIEAHYAGPLSLAEGKKKIIVCCDGTGNEFGDDNSNVVRLYTALEVNTSNWCAIARESAFMRVPVGRCRVS